MRELGWRLAARQAAGRLAGARRPELRPHGRADHRARRRGRDGDRPQPPVRGRGRRGPARARRDRRRASRSSSAAPCSPRRWSSSASSPTPRRPPGSSSPTSASSPPTADFDELAEAVRRGRVYAGFSGWGPGQLEAELEEDSWIVEPPIPAELFPDDPDDALERRPRAQGRPVRAGRADARGPVAELRSRRSPSLTAKLLGRPPRCHPGPDGLGAVGAEGGGAPGAGSSAR